MDGARKKLTYRVRQLPHHVDKLHVVTLLARLGLGPVENIRVLSLSCSLSHWERQPTKTSTVEFERAPTLLSNNKTEWILLVAGHNGLQQNIIIDTHFLDFTPLNDVAPAAHAFDCFAISGLASHPFGSWKHRSDDSSFMWLRDRLPRDLPQVRTILYGYDTKLVMSESFQTIDDLALSLIAKLKSIGRSLITSKPAIFLAHSLGGIVLKRALMILANGSDLDRMILSGIDGIIFFGVPNKGMHISHLRSMVEGQPNQALVESLGLDSEYLSTIDDQFSGIALSTNIRIVFAFETMRTQTTRQLSPSGAWSRTGPYEVLVDRASATRSQSNVHDILPINENHSDMVKFAEDDTNYKGIMGYLYELCKTDEGLDWGEEGVFDASESDEDISPPQESLGSEEDESQAWTLAAGTYESWIHAAIDQVHDTSLGGDLTRNPGSRAVLSNEQRKLVQYIENLQKMMRSLHAEEAESRYHEIDPAYPTTYQWVFEKLDFSQWLRAGRGVYWISGKPGSGKSTLMKTIVESSQTSKILQEWHKTRPPQKAYRSCRTPNQRRNNGKTAGGDSHSKIIETDCVSFQMSASFFFHDRGTHSQKSLEGLFSSILYQILAQAEFLCKMVLSIYLKEKGPRQFPWPLRLLETSIERVLEQKEQPVNIQLFLDALDEYDGPKEVIVNFIRRVAQLPEQSTTQIRVCFSSRPWQVFVDCFDNCPGFKIHEHTSHDIWNYVGGKMMQTSSLKQLYVSSPEMQGHRQMNDLIYEVIHRAQGVFLWVNLVMGELERASLQPVSHEQLMKVLSLLPTDLEQLYERIVDRLSDHDRLDAYIMLEIALRSEERLLLQDFSLAFACARCGTLAQCQREFESNVSSLPSMDASRHRLMDRCGGLVEVLNWSLEPQALSPKPLVQFMHQSVKEYVSRLEFQQQVLQDNQFLIAGNGYTFLSKFYLAKLQLQPPYNIPQLKQLLSKCITYAYMSESTTGLSQRGFLDSLLDSGFDVLSRIQGWDTAVPQHSLISFTATANLRVYMAEKLRTTPIKALDPTQVLLHQIAEATKRDRFVDENVLSPPFQWDYSGMGELLLYHGAVRDTVRKGLTPFQRIFSECTQGSSNGAHSSYSGSYLQEGTFADSKPPTSGPGPVELHTRISPAELRLAQTLLDHGQDPNTQITCRPREGVALAQCKALHLACRDLTAMLLRLGADVNALNDSGQTPLDIVVLGTRPTLADYEIAVLLCRKGGCVTSEAHKLVPKFVSCVESLTDNVDSCLRKVPLLRKKRRFWRRSRS